MINFYILALLVFLLFLILISIKIDYLSKLVSIYDFPDKKRKLHKNKTPIIGWIYPFFCILFLFLLSFFDNEHEIFKREIFTIYEKINIRSYISFFLGTLIIFFIGLFDDKKNISANSKIILLITILYLLISFDNSLLIQELYFTIFDKLITLEHFSLPFTVLCIFFLINSLNLYDGINLQSAIFFTFVYSVLILKGVFSGILIFFLVANFFFALKNHNGKIFYGDSGIYINSFIISYFIIKGYNFKNVLTPELIFIILYLPSLDLVRLFFVRIFKLQNPFDGDRTHIHHVLFALFNSNIYMANGVLLLMIILPFVMYDLLNFNFYISVLITTIMYFLFVINFYRYKKR
tara:strand:+ start:908 stop:1954 length:1047 start_codon:yes stop_codon:yes gene_type:complete